MSVINTNVNAIIAQNAGVKNERMQTTAMQRLSTGNRINTASDDAAGLAISTKMTSQIRGLDQAVRNANDGISLIQTAEGALTEVNNMLQRMRELAIQSASDTNTTSDRTSLNAEFVALRDEINRIGNNTQFNGMNVLDGSFVGNGAANAGKFIFQVGANAAQTIDITLGDFRTTGGSTASISTSSATVGGDQQVNNLTIADTASMAIGETLSITMANGPSGSSQTYVFTADAALATGAAISAALVADPNFASLLEITPSAGQGDNVGDVGVVKFTGAAGDTYTLSSTVGTMGAAQFTGTTQTDTLTFSDVSSGDIVSLSVGGSTYEYTATADLAAAALVDAIVADAAFTTWKTAEGVTASDGATTIALAGGVNATLTTTATVNSSTGGDLSMINASTITTQSASNSAVTALDSAISTVSGGRATMGATINRLNYAADNLLATSANVSASRSRIQDTDYSQATTELARTQIIQQASTAMLAQANQSAQSVLSLLK